MSTQSGSSGGNGGQEGSTGTPQTLTKEGGVSLQYPMLTKSNYAAWCIKMEVYMEAQGVWEAIESEQPVDPRRDKMALAAIYHGISEDTLLQLGAKKTAKEAWGALKTMHLGAAKLKEVRAQALRWELEGLRMRDEDTVDDFTSKISITVNQLRSLGEVVDEAYVVKKILRAVSQKFLQIASTIEEFGDVENKTIEEITGSLKAHEERMKGHETKSEEHVLLSRGEWNYRNTGGDRGRGQWRGTGTSRGQGRVFSQGGRYQENRQKMDMSKVRCYTCSEYGHFAYECKKGRGNEEINLTEKYYDEPTLLMMEECEIFHGDVDLCCETKEEDLRC